MSQLKKLVFSSKVIPLVLTAGLGLGVSLYLGITKNTANSLSFSNLTAIGAIASPISAAQAQQPTDKKVVRIGYQKYGTINLLKAKGTLEPRLKAKGVTVEWSLFPAGPQLLEALNAGKVDFGSTGEAPPIFAQAAGAPLVYVGNEPPNPKGEGILVLKNSPIKSFTDLKGKKIALNKGSNVHYFLVKALEKAGLKYTDVQVVFLPPGDARPAFEKGSVDAWAIWDPFYTNAKRSLDARIIKNGEGVVSNREFYLAAKPIVTQHPDRIKAILDELNKVGKWATANPKAVAELLSPQLNIDVPTLEDISRRRPYGVQTPLKPDVVKYQQSVADVFHKLGLIPKPIKVKDVVLNKKL